MKYRTKIRNVEAYRVIDHDVVMTPSGYRPVFAGDWVVITQHNHKLILTDNEFSTIFEKAPGDDTPIVGHTQLHDPDDDIPTPGFS